YKRLWDADRSIKDLELSLAYYRRGYQLVLERKTDPKCSADESYDAGAFTGANVIYVCEVFALEIPTEVDPERRAALLAEADRVRRELAQNLRVLQQSRPGDWWIGGTLLGVYFELGCRDPAYRHRALEQAGVLARIEVTPWAQQSTGSQLLRSAR